MSWSGPALSSVLPAGRATPWGALRRPVSPASARLAVAILLLNTVDALGTLRHISFGAEELNPVMDALLDFGPVPFFVGKHALASLGLVGILLYERTRPARIALRWVLLPVYLLVALYQAALFALL